MRPQASHVIRIVPWICALRQLNERSVEISCVCQWDAMCHQFPPPSPCVRALPQRTGLPIKCKTGRTGVSIWSNLGPLSESPQKRQGSEQCMPGLRIAVSGVESVHWGGAKYDSFWWESLFKEPSDLELTHQTIDLGIRQASPNPRPGKSLLGGQTLNTPPPESKHWQVVWVRYNQSCSVIFVNGYVCQMYSWLVLK